MKIGKKSVTSTGYTSTNSNKSSSVNHGPVQPGRDSVEVSESATLFEHALEAVQQVPDIRMEAVAPIQSEMDDGRYYRDEHEVAEKIIDDHMASPHPG